MTAANSLPGWIEAQFGVAPIDLAQWERALTHGSRSGESYERLEFLGDRVLGLIVAEWLYESFPDEPEGQLSRRFNTLVTGAACAAVARAIGAPEHLKLGKQARDDGATDSDNVLGDILESLLGVLYRERGLDTARAVVRRLWTNRLHAGTAAPQHPKSALQEWAAAHQRKAPVYEIVARTGPGHAPRFQIRVAIPGVAEAEAEGRNKQEAETAAATALLGVLSASIATARRGRGRPSTSSGRTEMSEGSTATNSVRPEPVEGRPEPPTSTPK